MLPGTSSSAERSFQPGLPLPDAAQAAEASLVEPETDEQALPPASGAPADVSGGGLLNRVSSEAAGAKPGARADAETHTAALSSTSAGALLAPSSADTDPTEAADSTDGPASTSPPAASAGVPPAACEAAAAVGTDAMPSAPIAAPDAPTATPDAPTAAVDAPTAAESSLLQLARIIRRGDPVVFVTGSGLSAPSGIPTFRGEGGVWAR